MALNFSAALAFTLVQEGGYKYTNNVADMGGSTYAGLTGNTVSNFSGRQISAAEMQKLTPQQVSDIYQKLFWLPFGFDDTDSLGLVAAVFDAGVLIGVTHSATLLQSCLGVKTDGKMGPISLAAMRQANVANTRVAFAQAFLDYLFHVVQHDSTQVKWALGWYTRAVKPLAAFA